MWQWLAGKLILHVRPVRIYLDAAQGAAARRSQRHAAKVSALREEAFVESGIEQRAKRDASVV